PPAEPLPDGCVLKVGTARFRLPDRGRVSWSADGKYLAVIEHGISLTLLDPDTGLPVRRLAGGYWEGSFALPGGDQLVHLDKDTVRVLDVRTGAELESTKLKLAPFESASLLPDGKRYIVTSAADTVLGDIRDRTRPDWNLRLGAGPVRGNWYVAPGGKWVLFAAGNGDYLVLDLATDKAMAFGVPLAVGSPIALDPDGRHVYLERDGSILIRA